MSNYKRHFPYESDAYRSARDKRLHAEMELRAQIERVAEQRRNLPAGGKLAADYVFVRKSDGIHHFWGSELLYAQVDGQPRHVDLLWSI